MIEKPRINMKALSRWLTEQIERENNEELLRAGRFRRGRRLTARTLGERTGVSHPTIANILNAGPNEPKMETLIALARYFGASEASITDIAYSSPADPRQEKITQILADAATLDPDDLRDVEQYVQFKRDQKNGNNKVITIGGIGKP